MRIVLRMAAQRGLVRTASRPDCQAVSGIRRGRDLTFNRGARDVTGAFNALVGRSG
jgi:hypothetical protein